MEDFAMFRVTLGGWGSGSRRAFLWAVQQVPLEFKEKTHILTDDSVCLVRIRSGWQIYVYAMNPVDMGPSRRELVIR